MLPFLYLLAIGAILFYIYALHHSRYWRRRGIPGPASRPFLGNINSIFGTNLAVLSQRKWTAEYGPVYGYQQGWTNVLVVSDVHMLNEMFNKKFSFFHGRKVAPLIGDVDKNPMVTMVASRGHKWKRLRTLATPSFSINNLKKVLPVMEDSCREMMVFFDIKYERDQPFNIHPHFQELTMDVISRIALGQKESRQFRTDRTAIVLRYLGTYANTALTYLSWIFPRLVPLFVAFDKLTWRLRKEPLREYYATIFEKVRQRKMEKEAAKMMNGHSSSNDQQQQNEQQQQQNVEDFIDFFLEAESDEKFMFKGDTVFQSSETKIERKLTLEEIASQLRLFISAGFDTTANTLAFSFWYLACRPDVQTKLQEEIATIFGDEPRDIKYEQLAKMKYAEAVVRETLRMQPLASSGFNRTAAENTTLGDYAIEKNTVVQADLLTLHYDKSLWGDDADEFMPERWFREERNYEEVQKWYGFGAGPRMCVGMKLAYMETKLTYIHLLSKYNIKACPETEKELQIRGQLVFSPVAVTVQLEKRKI